MDRSATPLRWLALASLIGGCASPVASRGAEITFESHGVELAGTIVAPADGAPHPGVLLIHGSGDDGRDNPIYHLLAEAFVREGFAVLIYDKRGWGQSGGSWRRSPFSILEDDAYSALQALKRHPWVDSTRLTVWGGSEGSVIAPAVALRDASVLAVLLQSVPGGTFAEQNLFQSSLQARACATDSIQQRKTMEMVRLRHSFARHGNGWDDYQAAVAREANGPCGGLAHPRDRRDWWWAWYRTKMEESPLPELRRLTQPVLAVWGERDVLVPAHSARRAVSEARRYAGTTCDSLLIVRHADHTIHINGLRGVLTRGPRNRPVHHRMTAAWAARIVRSACSRRSAEGNPPR